MKVAGTWEKTKPLKKRKDNSSEKQQGDYKPLSLNASPLTYLSNGDVHSLAELPCCCHYERHSQTATTQSSSGNMSSWSPGEEIVKSVGDAWLCARVEFRPGVTFCEIKGAGVTLGQNNLWPGPALLYCLGYRAGWRCL